MARLPRAPQVRRELEAISLMKKQGPGGGSSNDNNTDSNNNGTGSSSSNSNSVNSTQGEGSQAAGGQGAPKPQAQQQQEAAVVSCGKGTAPVMGAAAEPRAALSEQVLGAKQLCSPAKVQMGRERGSIVGGGVEGAAIVS